MNVPGTDRIFHVRNFQEVSHHIITLWEVGHKAPALLCHSTMYFYNKLVTLFLGYNIGSKAVPNLGTASYAAQHSPGERSAQLRSAARHLDTQRARDPRDTCGTRNTLATRVRHA